MYCSYDLCKLNKNEGKRDEYYIDCNHIHLQKGYIERGKNIKLQGNNEWAEKELCHVIGNVRFKYWDASLNNNGCNISFPQYDTIYIYSSDFYNADRALRTMHFQNDTCEMI